jgi:hypothetical protein
MLECLAATEMRSGLKRLFALAALVALAAVLAWTPPAIAKVFRVDTFNGKAGNLATIHRLSSRISR